MEDTVDLLLHDIDLPLWLPYDRRAAFSQQGERDLIRKVGKQLHSALLHERGPNQVPLFPLGFRILGHIRREIARLRDLEGNLIL